MAVKFNPFTAQLQLDQVGAGGGGSSYIDGEVQNFSALPETLGSPAVDSAYLVREAEGAWLLNRKPAGIYIRTANTGTRASDWTYAGEFPDVFNDANFVLYDNGDSTKNLQFQLSGITTGTTRTISVPDNDVTLPDQGTSTTDAVEFASVGVDGTPVGSARKFHQHGGKFTVESDDGGYGQFQVVNPTAGEVTFVMASDGATETDGTLTATLPENIWAFGLGPYGNNATDFCIGNNSGNSVFHIKPDGKVGLGSGNADPAEALDVDGNIAMRDLENDFSATFDADDKLSANRTYDLPDASGTLALTSDIPSFGTGAGEAAEGNHAHGNLTNDGKLGSTAGLPVVTTTAGAVTTLALGTAGQVLTVNSGANGVEFAAASGGGVTGAASSASDVLGVSGSNITGVDANADRIVFWDDSASALKYLEAGSGLSISGTTLSATGGGVTAVGASTADVLSVSGSDLVADDGGTIDSSDPFIKWDDTAGKLVYANPLSRPSGAFYVGLAPTTTALGTDALTIQANRGAGANRLASGLNTISIGNSTRASAEGGIAIGHRADSSDFYATAIGQECGATADDCVAIGGYAATASANNAVAIGRQTTANLRAMFSTRPFNAIYWGGQTTNNTATVLNLDATATNRFTIAASTALAVDILLVARRSDVADKWLVARRFLGIRRDGSNNTSLIGSVQTLGTDQSNGSPTWTFSLTADDTNEALELEVTGASGETVQWRATAFYRVV